MNVLVVLYERLDSNSAVHVHHLANGLADLGVDCAVAVPGGPRVLESLGPARYRTTLFQSLSRAIRGRLFRDGLGPQVVHAWTPRENVRRLCTELAREYRFRLMVHLEDNEDVILERLLGRPMHELRALPRLRIPPTMSHPVHYRAFVDAADAATVIVEPLSGFLPPSMPWMTLSPGVDHSRFYARPIDPPLAMRLDLAAFRFVIAYTGNVTAVNQREVREVYRAAAQLTASGLRTVVLRTGRDLHPVLEGAEGHALASIELGFVDYRLIPEVLACADMLVQPGEADGFNNYRLPAKLPEYLAMGRPTVMPRANLGRQLEDGRHALLYDDVKASEIVRSAQLLGRHGNLARRIAAGAAAFARQHLDWRSRAGALKDFYEHVLRDGARGRSFADGLRSPEPESTASGRLSAAAIAARNTLGYELGRMFGLRRRAW